MTSSARTTRQLVEGGNAQPAGRQLVESTAALQLRAVTREIDNRMSIVAASAAAGIDPERLKLVALTVFTRTPGLLSCDPVSVARAIVEAGQLGLEPTGLLGGAYLVPRGGQATLMIGYKGLVMLAMRSGAVRRVEARIVREKDAFAYEYGLVPRLTHTPSREVDPGPLTYAYAVIVYADGERQFDVMSLAEIELIRGRSSAKNNGPWVTDYFEMCKKTVLRRALKLAPLAVQVATKLDEIDPEVDEGAPAPDTARRLRDGLQRALLEEYGGQSDGGGSPGPAQASPVVEAPVSGEGPAEGAAPLPAEPTAPAPPSCGARSEQLGMGPCVLPDLHRGIHEQADGGQWRG